MQYPAGNGGCVSVDRIARLDLALFAQKSVIGSMLIDERCVPLVFQKLRPEDFTEPTCRTVCRAIHKLFLEQRPLDSVTIVGAIKGGDSYVPFMREVMDETPTAANVEAYIDQVREASMMYRFRELCEKGIECSDTTEAATLAQKMSLVLSATDRMSMMTGQERVADFHARMKNPEKPKYLPWGIPIADRATYAELGDMILLGGYASSGKTLLSILMAQTQAKAGYTVGYSSLETSPQKMTDRQLSSLAQVPLRKIKTKDFGDSDWNRLAEAEVFAATEGSFAVIDASGSTADDITTHALGHGFQIIYVDYVQNLVVPGMRDTEGYAKVTAISQTLKVFARRTNTAVVALAQLTRPQGESSKDDKDPTMPTMHSFKGSGQLEQDADVAFLVFPCNRKKNNSNRFFAIVKNKEGSRPDPVELAFYGETQTMVELVPEPDHSVAAEMAAKGRAAQQANRAKAQQYQEVKGKDKDNPFID